MSETSQTPGKPAKPKTRPVRITAKLVENLKPKPKQQYDVFDAVVRGLTLRVSAGGAKSWSLTYRVRARKKRWTIGKADEQRGGLSVASARAKAASALTALRDHGIDPAEVKEAERNAETFEGLVTSYLKAAKLKKKTWAEDERMLMKVVKKEKWGHRAAKDITTTDVHDLLAPIAERAPIAANRLHAALSSAFMHAVRLKQLSENPCRGLPKQPERKRERVLTDEELRELWTALEGLKVLRRDDEEEADPPIGSQVARGLQVLLLTAQRSGETFSMKWENVDLSGKWWTIPSTVTKSKRTHRVPLTPKVIELLKEAKAQGPEKESPYVFASLTKPKTHVGIRSKRAMAALKKAGAITFDATRHDLRRTAATNMRRAGVTRDSVAFVLNHELVSGGAATGSYDHYDGDSEKRAALLKWERRLLAILAAKDDATKEKSRVVAFSR